MKVGLFCLHYWETKLFFEQNKTQGYQKVNDTRFGKQNCQGAISLKFFISEKVLGAKVS